MGDIAVADNLRRRSAAGEPCRTLDPNDRPSCFQSIFYDNWVISGAAASRSHRRAQ